MAAMKSKVIAGLVIFEIRQEINLERHKVNRNLVCMSGRIKKTAKVYVSYKKCFSDRNRQYKCVGSVCASKVKLLYIVCIYMEVWKYL